MARALIADLVKSNGALATASTSKITLRILNAPSGAKLTSSGGTIVLTPSKGAANFGKLSFTVAGNYLLQVTSPGFVNAAISFTVLPAAAKTLAFTKVPVTRKSSLPFLVGVTLYDAFHNVVTTDSRAVTLSLVTHPAHSTLTGVLTHNLVAGAVFFGGLRVSAVGAYTLKASINLQLVALSPTINYVH
jgi:hypothetical protein